MGPLEIVLGIIVIILAIAIIALVLMQSGKEKSLSGAIAGSAESFFGRGKSQTKEKILGRITTIAAVLFAVLVVVLFIVLA